MHPLVARIRRTVRRFSLIPPDARVLVAVSGGADSVALLHAMLALQEMSEAKVVGVAHLNHGLRGEAADQDEAFCRSMAEELRLSFASERVDVLAVAREQGWTTEAAGHRCRYDFLEGAAKRLSADLIALGHTRDDQAETFLLRLLRGAGPRGLGGMHPRIGKFIRPMLDCSRGEVRAYVAERRLPYREDETNADRSIPRNRVRLEILPALAALTPSVTAVFSREAAIAREDHDFLEAAADKVFRVAVKVEPGRVRLDAVALAGEPPAIARRVVARALAILAARRHVGFMHVQAVLDMIRSPRHGSTVSLPGQEARFTAGVVEFLEATGARPAPGRGTSFEFLLSIPGEAISPFGWSLSAERRAVRCPGDSFVEEVAGVGGSSAVLDISAVRQPLGVRNWRPGDRMRPLGMTGTRKLQDLFVDRKTPRHERLQVPVVVDAAGRILWVAGHAIGEDFRVTPATCDVVILKLKYWRNGT